jgi:flavin-dependent dehydrogenase
MKALDRARAVGAELAGILVRSPSGHEIRGTFHAAHGFRPYSDRGLSVRRELLDSILLDCARAAGADVREGVRVVDLARTGDGVATGVDVLAADGRSRRTIRAQIVIAADGLRSTIATRMGVTRRIPWPERLALVAHFEGVKGMHELAEMHVERDGFVGIADVGSGLTTVALVVPAAQARRISADRRAFLREWLGRRRQLVERFARAQQTSDVMATGPFASHARRAWAPGVLLVGDAADFFDPFTGPGIYSAVRGGELAADVALNFLTGPRRERTDSLREYDRMRRTTFSGKWTVERVIAGIVGTPVLIDRAASVLAARKDLADVLAGVTGDFIPARTVISARYILSAFGILPASRGPDPAALPFP